MITTYSLGSVCYRNFGQVGSVRHDKSGRARLVRVSQKFVLFLTSIQYRNNRTSQPVFFGKSTVRKVNSCHQIIPSWVQEKIKPNRYKNWIVIRFVADFGQILVFDLFPPPFPKSPPTFSAIKLFSRFGPDRMRNHRKSAKAIAVWHSHSTAVATRA